jgi:hypothetical protein
LKQPCSSNHLTNLGAQRTDRVLAEMFHHARVRVVAEFVRGLAPVKLYALAGDLGVALGRLVHFVAQQEVRTQPLASTLFTNASASAKVMADAANSEEARDMVKGHRSKETKNTNIANIVSSGQKFSD